MAHKFLGVVTSPATLRAQEHYYGRARPVPPQAGNDPLGPREAEFIAARDSFYVASVGESGWPYLQHRGGPAGFLRVRGPSTLAFADYAGNHQMITTGNLASDDRVALLLIDYPNRRRLKILGHARVEDARDHFRVVERVVSPEARPDVERIVIIEVVAFDWNCPQHITPRFTVAQVASIVEPLQRQIASLQAQLASVATSKQQEGAPS